MVRCTKGVVSSKPVLVQQNIAVVSKPTNVEVGPAKVEKEKFNKRRLPGNKVVTWDNLMQLVGVNVNSLSKSTNNQFKLIWYINT